MSNSIHLKRFSSEELILNKSETRTILKFFWPAESVANSTDESLVVTDLVREFAQGLLVEAINSSYHIGFVEAVFRVSANPVNNALTVFKNFGKRASRHWFEHVKASDLTNVRIYEIVRKDLSRAFRVTLNDHLYGIAQLNQQAPTTAILSYSKIPPMAKVWG